MADVEVCRPGELAGREGAQTSGMARREAVMAGGAAIHVRTSPGSVSGWRHHGTTPPTAMS